MYDGKYFVNLHPKIIYPENVLTGLINIFVPVSSEILAQIITPIVSANTETAVYFWSLVLFQLNQILFFYFRGWILVILRIWNDGQESNFQSSLSICNVVCAHFS